MISHVMPIPTSAGNEMRILKLLKILKSKGFSIIYLLNQTSVNQSSVQRLKEYVEEVYYIDSDRIRMDKKIVSSAVEFLSNKNQIKKYLCPPELVYLTSILDKKYKPFAVIAEYIFTSPCLEVVSSGVLKIIDTHDMFSNRNREEHLYCTPEEEREYILKCDLLMAIQPTEATLFSKMVPEKEVISVGIDYDFEDKPKRNNTIFPNVFVVGSENVPNVSGLNNFYDNVWHKILKSIPNAQLRVAGSICNKIVGDNDSIKLLGLVDDLDAEYSNASVVINPTSIGTGLKIKTVEALCHGKAFVGTPNSVEGLPKTSEQVFCKCENWNEFAESIISLLKSNEKRHALEDAAFNYAKQNFNKEKVYKPLLEKLNEQCNKWEELKSICPVCEIGKFVRYGKMDWNVWGEDYHLVQCKECESIFTNPLPNDETLARFYSTEFNYNWYRDHYGAKLLDCQTRVQEYKNHLGKRVLDFGGGLGYFSQVARSEGYHSITFDPYVENTQMPEKNWDSIVTLHVLEHSNNLDRTINLMKDYLKPGGKIILVVPNAKSDGYRLQGMNWVWAQPPLLHLFHFTYKGLKLLLERNGLSVEKVSYHERWDANLYSDLEKVREYQTLDAEWGQEELKKNPSQRALVAWRNSTLRVKALEEALKNYDPSNEKYAELQIIAKKENKNPYRIGLINNRYIIEHNSETACFQISNYELSFYKILYSAFSTPARYIMELFVRLSSINENSENIIVFNPFFAVSQMVYDKILNEINRITDFTEITIFADHNEVPIAYVFPNSIPLHDSRYLSFLSGMSAELDAAYLRNCYLIKTNCVYLSKIYLNKKTANNSFNYNDNYDKIYSWITDSAIKTLAQKYGRIFNNNQLSTIEINNLTRLRKVKHEIPCDVIMPYHAGDALFLSLALKYSFSFINRILISRVYEDIIKDSTPDFETFPVDIKPFLRDNNGKSDEAIFWDVISKLKGPDLNERFHYYFRPSREYRISDIHLIDHYYFAIGISVKSREELLSLQLMPELILPKKLGKYFKILIHIEGGWPIKTYPENYLIELVKNFNNNGFLVTVLSSKLQKCKDYDVVKYTNLENYKNLLATHNLVIGMDSFPVHYAAHVAGVPTICLFGNTKPVNSDAIISKHYKYLFGNLNCAGCFSFDRCTLNNKIICDNFPKPDEVFKAATEMLELLYNNQDFKEDLLIKHINEGDLMGAISIVEADIEANPQDLDKYLILGQLSEAIENYEKAIGSYKKAVELDENNIHYKKALANLYMKVENIEEALGTHLEILNIRPYDAQTLIQVGNIFALNGNSNEAARCYNKVLTLDPGNQIAIGNLFELYK